VKDYNKANIPVAKMLRKNMTRHEKKLWYDFLSKYPVRFQRQKAIGNYIADFYCAKARLVIELDGSGHSRYTQKAKDAVRTAALENINLRVLRFRNIDIDNGLDMVCRRIDNVVKEALSQETLPPLSLPQSLAVTAPSSDGDTLLRDREKTIDSKHKT